MSAEKEKVIPTSSRDLILSDEFPPRTVAKMAVLKLTNPAGYQSVMPQPKEQEHDPAA